MHTNGNKWKLIVDCYRLIILFYLVFEPSPLSWQKCKGTKVCLFQVVLYLKHAVDTVMLFTCLFTSCWLWSIVQCINTVGVKCSPLLPILTDQGASAQIGLLLYSVTVTLQVNKTDGSAQVFLGGKNAWVKDTFLRMGEELTFQT